MKQLSG